MAAAGGDAGTAVSKRIGKSLLDPWVEQLADWLNTDNHRPKRDRRTAKVIYQAIKAQGYAGGYGRVCAWVRRWNVEHMTTPKTVAYVPLAFELGEAFQFDWSCEYACIAGLRRRLEVAHLKLAASRAFWMGAYFTQSHEMLFDAHTRAFAALGGVPRRGIYDYVPGNIINVLCPRPLCGRHWRHAGFARVGRGRCGHITVDFHRLLTRRFHLR